VYVGDAVRAFLAAGDSGRPGTWNIGTGVEVSVLDLVAIIGVVAGRGVRPAFAGPRPGELQRSAVATERAASELGWRAAMPLAEGVRRVYQWIESGAPDRAPC
jgi:UDP-glucose 4-epimerase